MGGMKENVLDGMGCCRHINCYPYCIVDNLQQRREFGSWSMIEGGMKK